jgi:uncharacterized protein (TIGR02284 family)
MYMDKAISTLNDLLEINNDRIEGYKTAIDETDDLELKSTFNGFKETSEKCKQALEQEILRCGGKPTQETRMSGKMFRVWMDFKAAISSKDRATILKSCEQGEDAAVKAYENVLTDHPTEKLSSDQIQLVDGQYRIIKADHDLVRSLRDAAVAANEH